MIRVMVVDDNDRVRRSVIFLLRVQDDIEVIGEAENGKKALELCKELHPDIIVMDLIMPDMDGITAARLSVEECPGAQVVILTSSLDHNLIAEALDAGAAEVVQKADGGQRLLKAIYKLADDA